MTAARTTGFHRWPTIEAAAAHLRRHNGGTPEWIDRVARRMFEGHHCVWHAAWEDTVEGYDTGRIPTVPCPHCGGRADPEIGFHWMCKARADRGMTDIPKLDVGNVECHCATCAKARGNR